VKAQSWLQRYMVSQGEFTNATTDNAICVFKRTEDIGGGLILRMRLLSGTITVSMGHLTRNTLKLRMRHLSGK